MRVTINVPERMIFMAGTCHELSRDGVNRLFLWLMDNGALLWGWDCGEYVFQVDQVAYATD